VATIAGFAHPAVPGEPASAGSPQNLAEFAPVFARRRAQGTGPSLAGFRHEGSVRYPARGSYSTEVIAMLFPIVGSLAGMTLLLTPFMWETGGARADLAALVGLVALICAPLTIVSKSARWPMGIAGMLLVLANFLAPGSIGSLAYFATGGSLLLLAAAAPQPIVEAPVRDVEAAAPADAAEEDPTHRLQHAA
jgi:hypothetical protein